MVTWDSIFPTPVMRVSLAFNAFIKGELGSEERLNRLVV
jgi:hypothetical protein